MSAAFKSALGHSRRFGDLRRIPIYTEHRMFPDLVGTSQLVHKATYAAQQGEQLIEALLAIAASSLGWVCRRRP